LKGKKSYLDFFLIFCLDIKLRATPNEPMKDTYTFQPTCWGKIAYSSQAAQLLKLLSTTRHSKIMDRKILHVGFLNFYTHKGTTK
jgi:hypothetical protein